MKVPEKRFQFKNLFRKRMIWLIILLFREFSVAVPNGVLPVAEWTYKELPESVLKCPKEATNVEPFMYEGFDEAFVEGPFITAYNIPIFDRQWRQGLTCYYASSFLTNNQSVFLLLSNQLKIEF